MKVHHLLFLFCFMATSEICLLSASAQYQQTGTLLKSPRRYDFLGTELLTYLNKRERASITGDWGLDGIRTQLDGMSSEDVKALIRKWFELDGMSLKDARDCADKLVLSKPVDWISKFPKQN